MTHPYPTPPIQPFNRLNVSDGLLITAERWKRAQDYHRQRQNIHYQSVNQPGIVCGLGVSVIPAPAHQQARDRDERWVQVQPGIAIDLEGNLIIVPKPFDYHIDTELKESEPITVYLVVSYRDPDHLQPQTSEMVQETYRLEETTSPPRSLDVELCRILLQAGTVAIRAPEDVFFPGYNQLDLRHRMQAQARPQALVRVAQLNRTDPDATRNFFHLQALLQSVETLYPVLKGAEEVGQVGLSDGIAALQPYDLLYLTGRQKLALNSAELATLKDYLELGGILLVDCLPNATKLSESIQALAQKIAQPMQSLATMRHHPIRTRPFLFSALPLVHQQPIQVSISGGIVMIQGDIASAWGLDDNMNTSRIVLRTAQEFGVNLLHYAWRRRQLIGLQQQDVSGQW
ncbi:MAG: DUF4159 domain-containing protein [Cyanobacteria bacterium RM1_2_2]|nr:DUF4159 domain-containing protein [Cyanobacteria bacterium RM1_2_2]